MLEIFFNITKLFQLSVFIMILYYTIISFFGLYKPKKGYSRSTPEKSFAMVVPAHNEELVIGQIVESFKALDYPRELYDIFVIADNCEDGTADVAQKHGAIVCKRSDPDNRGKGYALEWMFKKLFSMERKYDAVVVFDADNLASKNFLNEMNMMLKKGYRVVQGYLDSKNPHDSWISECYSIAFWTSNRLFQLGRANLGLSNQIGGTGFCVDMETLREIGWGTTCLTEDLELTCKLILKGYKVGWAHDAIIYDEKPLTLCQSWRQRKRWMQGFADVASRFFFKLMHKAILERNLVALDCALYTLQPFVIVAFGISTILTFIQMYSSHGAYIYVINYLFNPVIWKIFSIFQFLFTPFVMMLEKKLSKRLFVLFSFYSLNIFVGAIKGDLISKILPLTIVQIGFFTVSSAVILIIDGKTSVKIFIRYLLYGFYILTWIPITIQGIINKDNKEWSHTKHTRQIGINDVENIDGRTLA